MMFGYLAEQQVNGSQPMDSVKGDKQPLLNTIFGLQTIYQWMVTKCKFDCIKHLVGVDQFRNKNEQ